MFYNKLFFILILLGISFLFFINNKDRFTQQHKPTITIFYTEWCGHSKKMMPIWDEISSKYNNNINFKKVNCEDDTDNKCGINNIRFLPTIIFYKINDNGKEYISQYKLGSNKNRFEDWIKNELKL